MAGNAKTDPADAFRPISMRRTILSDTTSAWTVLSHSPSDGTPAASLAYVRPTITVCVMSVKFAMSARTSAIAGLATAAASASADAN